MKIDGRKHDHKTLEAIRKMAVRRIREGNFWYSVYTGRLNAARFVEFLKDFMRYRRRPVFLVVDGLPAHKAKLVAAYVQFLRGKLELHFLPGYAPDLNSDEFVWNHLRHHGTTKTPLRKNESLHRRVEENLAAIKNSPKLVSSFFMLRV